MEAQEISNIIIASSTILLLFGVFLFSIIVLHNHRKGQYRKQLQVQKEKFQEELMKTQLEIQAQTLKHVAQEIHDNIGQTLSLVKLNLRTVQTTEEKVQASRELVAKAIHDLRHLSRSLITDALLSGGLVQAIGSELALVAKSGVFQTQLTASSQHVTLGSKKELILFRIIQESINNIIKHAAATAIHIRIQEQSSALHIAIQDNGKGFDLATANTDGLGLKNMKSRAQLIGGTFEIRSAAGGGTTIHIKVSTSSI